MHYRPTFGFFGLGSVIATTLAAQLFAASALRGGFDPVHARRAGKGSRHKTGYRYPHSSTRQQARYARQIAAGQLSMAGVGR